MCEEQELLLDCLSKDEDKAYVLLYHHYYIPLVLFSAKYVGDEDMAKDLVQEVFIGMLGQKKAFVHLVALKVYLYNSVRNRSLNYLRDKKARKEIENKLLQETEDEDLFWDRVMEEDVYARLMTAVDTLPRQYRRVMQLSLEGRRISEVAEEMQISLDTAKEYKKEGKRRLTEQLQQLSWLIALLFSL